MINICIYEDDEFQNLLPLTFLRPAYDLLIGMDTIFDKFYRYFSYGNITLHCRDYLTHTVKLEHPHFSINKITSGAPCLFLNGRVLMNEDLFTKITEEDQNRSLLFTQMGQVVALYVHGDQTAVMRDLLNKIPSQEEIIKIFRPKCFTKELEDTEIITGHQDLVTTNKKMIKQDFKRLKKRGVIQGDVKPFVSMYNEQDVYVGKQSLIEDFVVLDASKGPIYIDENVTIESHSRIEGPVFIGKNAAILGGRIKSSSIGPFCKIGGEVSHCVFYRFSNKAHTGFLGHSYVGEWVNLGAGTTNSNLKNNYQPVKLSFGDKEVQTNQLFLGAAIGDHVKTGIGTLLNTGTLIGYGSSLFGSELHEKYIPPFAWGAKSSYQKHDLQKFFKTAEAMMSRRHRELHTSQTEVIQLNFDRLTTEKN